MYAELEKIISRDNNLRATSENGFLYIYLKKNSISKGISKNISLNSDQWLSLTRPKIFWMEPAFGNQPNTIEPETQFLLLKLQNKYGLLLPVVDRYIRTTIQGADVQSAINLVWDGSQKLKASDDVLLAIYIEGSDIYNMINTTMSALQNKLPSFKLMVDKKEPDYIKHFGWCTWDAFYQDVSYDGIIKGLQSFKDAEMTPGYVMLDDGWQDVSKNLKLLSFNANKKFPGNLKTIIQKSKDDFNINYFGVWHAFEGYWLGIEKTSELKQYKTVDNSGRIRPWEGDKEVEQNLSMIVPEDIHRFYEDFYSFLDDQGVDMVKVDNQSALEAFSKNKFNRCTTMKTYQDALQSSVENHFNGQSIHCMANSSDVAFNMKLASIWRNSDDYLPKADLQQQKHHIVANSFNAIWTSTFAIPDWDIFQSHGPAAELHAASRAISGGPIYVSDKPYHQNFDIIEKLIDENCMIYKADRAALPAAECIFKDPENSANALKLTNIVRNNGIIAIFNLTKNYECLNSSASADEIHDLKGDKFICYSYKKQTAVIVNQTDKITSEVNNLDFEILSFAPLQELFSPLGLKEKYLGIAAVAQNNINEFTIRGKGTAMFYTDKKIQIIEVNGERETNWSIKNNIIEVPIDKTSIITFKI